MSDTVGDRAGPQEHLIMINLGLLQGAAGPIPRSSCIRFKSLPGHRSTQMEASSRDSGGRPLLSCLQPNVSAQHCSRTH
eukprot:287337-Chlamydomonas_euryale.AAC.3